MRHIGRTHRVDLAFIHERFAQRQMPMQRTDTKNMSAHFVTKTFVNSDEWKHVRGLIATARTLDDTFQIVSSSGGPSGLAPSHVAPDLSSTQTEMKLENAHNKMMRNPAALGAAAPRAKDS